ncbi:hypothetical protein B0T24DRAFT_642237 [Lasiosphaeria ovina]|uniref:C2H2-type domain-containing protein n=1 Tax=Lasiosphaeria ovina TaxID=92902 RepID=A0AAE0JUI5_9PEZI|nr:hypothetical protein B0T24DRAFT_642237 [Lasiosphaeria ovina]
MLSPPLSGTFNAIEAVEHTACDRSEIPPGPASAGKRSKARALCTWKDCDHREPDTDKMKKHAATHRRCPKEDCSWADARDQKETKRHVWSNHKAWAESTGYPSMDAQCDECPAVFTREDSMIRHKKKAHGTIKRVKK